MKLFRRKKPAATEPEVQSAPLEASAVEAEEQDPLQAQQVDQADSTAPEISAESAAKAAADTVPSQTEKGGWYARLKQGLSRTRGQLSSGLGSLFLGRKVIDADLLEELESTLLMADVGIEATTHIVEQLTAQVSRKELANGEALLKALKQALTTMVGPCESAMTFAAMAPTVILMVGVNGAGKTTTIGKLAQRYKAEGKSVMLAAGDTFRAAAVEQLQVWGERNDIPVVAQHTGADSASVIFDALQAAQARSVDVLIADTAGRLHNKDNLMEELKKVVRVMKKLNPNAPHEVMLVLDATMGQNAVAQAEHFKAAVDVSGITLTKLDGTAKGGVIFAIAHKLGIPIRYIGVGESLEDLRPFEAAPFVNALFDEANV
ncbi:MAG: signal recognition particle-docking protein FtsY [Halieaceae bacterium]|nr:signal recognition particle-docking protein FtsY [Halieaceae bacterium]